MKLIDVLPYLGQNVINYRTKGGTYLSIYSVIKNKLYDVNVKSIVAVEDLLVLVTLDIEVDELDIED